MILLCLLASIIEGTSSTYAFEKNPHIIVSSSYEKEVASMKRDKLSVLIFFSGSDCQDCPELDNDFNNIIEKYHRYASFYAFDCDKVLEAVRKIEDNSDCQKPEKVGKCFENKSKLPSIAFFPVDSKYMMPYSQPWKQRKPFELESNFEGMKELKDNESGFEKVKKFDISKIDVLYGEIDNSLPCFCQLVKDTSELYAFLTTSRELPKVLYFTEEKDPPRSLRYISTLFKQNFDFVAIDSSSSELMKEYKVTALPKMIILKRKSTHYISEAYDGPKTLEGYSRFLKKNKGETSVDEAPVKRNITDPLLSEITIEDIFASDQVEIIHVHSPMTMQHPFHSSLRSQFE